MESLKYIIPSIIGGGIVGYSIIKMLIDYDDKVFKKNFEKFNNLEEKDALKKYLEKMKEILNKTDGEESLLREDFFDAFECCIYILTKDEIEKLENLRDDPEKKKEKLLNPIKYRKDLYEFVKEKDNIRKNAIEDIYQFFDLNQETRNLIFASRIRMIRVNRKNYFKIFLHGPSFKKEKFIQILDEDSSKKIQHGVFKQMVKYVILDLEHRIENGLKNVNSTYFPSMFEEETRQSFEDKFGIEFKIFWAFGYWLENQEGEKMEVWDKMISLYEKMISEFFDQQILLKEGIRLNN